MTGLEEIEDEKLVQEIQKRLEEKNVSLKESEFLNKKLLDLNKNLIEMDSVKSQFLSLVKNELNNPISSVLNLCQILIVGKKPEKAPEVTQMLHMEVLRLDFQLKNIIAASEIEAGETENYYTRIGFETMFEDVKSSFQYLIRDKNLNVSLRNETTCQIYSDAGKLSLILLNLVSNACEYTYEKGTIVVSLQNDENFLYVAVEDDGEGIDVEVKESVYTRFAQFNKFVNRAKTGLGLGLSIVKSEAEALGGSVDYESEAKHTVFTVRLPLKQDCDIDGGSGGANDVLFEDFGDAFEL